MAEKEQVSAALLTADAATLIPWPEARTRLTLASSYWVATVRPDGWPHEVTPTVVFGFGTDEAFAPRSTRWRF